MEAPSLSWAAPDFSYRDERRTELHFQRKSPWEAGDRLRLEEHVLISTPQEERRHLRLASGPDENKRGGDNNIPPRHSRLAAPRLNWKAGREGAAAVAAARMRTPEGMSRASFLLAPPPPSLRGGKSFPQRKSSPWREGGKSGVARAQAVALPCGDPPPVSRRESSACPPGTERPIGCGARVGGCAVQRWRRRGGALLRQRCRRGSLSPGLSEVSEPASLPPAAPSSIARGAGGLHPYEGHPSFSFPRRARASWRGAGRQVQAERGTAVPRCLLLLLSKVCAVWSPLLGSPFPRAVEGRARGRRISSLSSAWPAPVLSPRTRTDCTAAPHGNNLRGRWSPEGTDCIQTGRLEMSSLTLHKFSFVLFWNAVIRFK